MTTSISRITAGRPAVPAPEPAWVAAKARRRAWLCLVVAFTIWCTLAGSIGAAVARARARTPHTGRIEVEVTSLAQLEEAIAAGADIIMLDNMDDDLVKAAIARAAREKPRPILEASGGITLERVARLSALGIDIISVGALTHSAKAADISLELELERS